MNILNYLQRIGRALMVPVALLPVSAILMGIGYWIDSGDWGANSGIAALLIKPGSAIIDNMSVLFAIGVAYGMSKDKDGAAALTGFVGFLVVITLCAPESYSIIMDVSFNEVPEAFNKINNQFVGIIVGILSAELYNRYSSVELPQALSFFSGRRIVPILTSFLMLFLAFILMYVWPIIYNGLVSFGQIIKDLGAVGAGIYAFFNRLLIPVGLHHVLNSVFWFDVVGINDIPNFLGGAQSIEEGIAIPGITGRYQAGFFPIMLFGLPGAALAIYHCARPENKEKVAGIMMAGAFSAFFTGITEPIEFSFMFVAPVLYVIHALLMGISVYISATMEWISGFGFSAGLVDMLLQSRNPLAIHWWMLIIQGIVFFCIYYVIFRFMIKKLNLITPGREESSHGKIIDYYRDNLRVKNNSDTNIQKIARQYVAALGGSDNLTSIDACITRLRLVVKDASIVNDIMVKDIGASGLIRLNKQSLQVIIGTRAELVASAMKDVIAKGPIAAFLPISVQETETIINPEQTQNKVILSVFAPVSGEICSLDDVPDQAFSTRVVGDGVAIKANSSEVLAPVSGKIVKIFETNHAFCIVTDNGVELIVHIGIDTVILKGKGFTRLVDEGRKVKAGMPILKLNIGFLESHTKSIISPVIISNIDDFSSIEILGKGYVIAGETIIYNVLK
ncbi:PTS system N-acetylglucosamine-specific EIICBA component [Candidatus Hartigia pinicola]|nr:PTS system N-acetylglucosamine-specific EIICBA component [Candidatus Hartigia pinicola]